MHTYVANASLQRCITPLYKRRAQWQIQDLPGGEGKGYGEREPKWRSEGRQQAEQSPWWGIMGRFCPLKLKAFCQFSYKKWPKDNDLNENLPP